MSKVGGGGALSQVGHIVEIYRLLFKDEEDAAEIKKRKAEIRAKKMAAKGKSVAVVGLKGL